MSSATIRASEAASDEIICFEVGDSLFGLPMNQVQEISRDVEVWPVPHAPREVKGLINLRGRVVTVMDVHSRLEIASTQPHGNGRNIIVRSEGELIALHVDRIVDTLTIARRDVKPAPKDASPTLKDLLSGVYCRESQLVSLLDLEALLAVVDV